MLCVSQLVVQQVGKMAFSKIVANYQQYIHDGFVGGAGLKLRSPVIAIARLVAIERAVKIERSLTI